MKKEVLIQHFVGNLAPTYRGWIGAEVETHFVDSLTRPITVECSQRILTDLCVTKGWSVSTRKNNLITELVKNDSKILYDLGQQNIELATRPQPHNRIADYTQLRLCEIYDCARLHDAYPLFEPIIETDEKLLLIPDDRDRSWLELDGEHSLNIMAKTASVQFTIEAIDPDHAIYLLQHFAETREKILKANPYQQEECWHEYLKLSNANYRSDRYGVVFPHSIEHYVDMLSLHDVVVDGKLVPFDEADQNIDLFLRSVWWNFRLRRYGDYLCIEIRTLSRRTDSRWLEDFEALLNILLVANKSYKQSIVASYN